MVYVRAPPSLSTFSLRLAYRSFLFGASDCSESLFRAPLLGIEHPIISDGILELHFRAALPVDTPVRYAVYPWITTVTQG